MSTVASAPHIDSRPHLIRSDAEAITIAARLADQFRTGAAQRDRERILPRAEIEALTREGIYGICVPKVYGGAEVSAVTVAEVFRLLGAADPSIAQIPQNHFSWISVLTHGRPDQQSYFFNRILAGDRIGNAHSENSRNKPGTYTHTLVREAGGWRITGRKYYSTGALFAHWIPFIGAGEDGTPQMFFARADAQGLTPLDDWNAMGQRTTASGTTVFDKVFVPDEHIFPYAANEVSGHSFLHYAQLIHSAIDIGIAEEVLAEAKRYIHQHNRPWTGNPFDEHAKEPLVISEFGKQGLLVRTARAMLRRAAECVDAARRGPGSQGALDARLAVADARVVTAEAAVKVSTDFFALTGARATLPEFALDRHWRNARTHTLHDPLRWKYFHLGNYDLNGVVPGAQTYI